MGKEWKCTDQVLEKLEDEPDHGHLVQRIHQTVVSRPYERVMVSNPVCSAQPAPRSRRSRRRTTLAMRNRRMSAWMKSTSSTGTPALICIGPAPARMAPKRRAASMIPIGFDRPSRATVIAADPAVVLNVVFIWWGTPRIVHAPGKPASEPAMLMVSTINRRGF